MIQAPKFWRRRGLLSWLLLPLGLLYGAVSALNIWRRGRSVVGVGVPVVAVGNIASGGTGKTPLVAWLAQKLAASGKKVAILSRGYGGVLQGVQVAKTHTAAEVGDEPLMLFQQVGAKAAIWVGRDRKELAVQAVAAGAEVIILDDGFQYVGLKRDLNILVVGADGFGSGFPLPAGPLREFVGAAKRADCVVHYGPTPKADVPCFKVGMKSQPPLETPLFLFAGLGSPQKFFDGVAAAGGQVVGTKIFPDHHGYTEADVASLKAQAKKLGATLATTHKDAVKMPPNWGGKIVPVQLVGNGLDGLWATVLNSL